jgi:hypothetical protein
MTQLPLLPYSLPRTTHARRRDPHAEPAWEAGRRGSSWQWPFSLGGSGHSPPAPDLLDRQRSYPGRGLPRAPLERWPCSPSGVPPSAVALLLRLQHLSERIPSHILARWRLQGTRARFSHMSRGIIVQIHVFS